MGTQQNLSGNFSEGSGIEQTFAQENVAENTPRDETPIRRNPVRVRRPPVKLNL